MVKNRSLQRYRSALSIVVLQGHCFHFPEGLFLVHGLYYAHFCLCFKHGSELHTYLDRFCSCTVFFNYCIIHDSVVIMHLIMSNEYFQYTPWDGSFIQY